MNDRARVLVVDDELGPRESLRMILKPSYEIATAESGEEALRTVGVFHPDLVFMDIKMPQMDGMELLRRIKATDPSIEVVMITAYASLDTVRSALTHGAFEYLIKPFSRKDLEETARRALARRQTEIGTQNQVASLVEEMRTLAARSRELEEANRREQADVSLRLTQLSLAREISRGIITQLDLTQLTTDITTQLREALGYAEVSVSLGPTPPARAAGPAIVCPIAGNGITLGHLVAANRAGERPIDAREQELLEMVAESLAGAIQNSQVYGEMAANKQFLERVIGSAGEAIIAVDAEDRIKGWNPAAERIFRLPGAQALGQPITAILPEEPYRAERAALFAEPSARNFDVSTKLADGRALTLAVTLSALPGRDDAVEGLLALIRDTTVQRELDAQMHQSEKLTALGQMAGGIAHDFNNLLQAILGYAQLMNRNPANVDVVRRGLEVIEKAATGGAETVRRIQKFARLRPEEAFIALDLDQVIRDALAITRPRWEEKKIKAGLPLQLELERGAVPVVMGRPAELNEVVTNLILNAIDAMPQGGTLTIRTRRHGDRQVVFTVQDTGIGMTDEVRKRIFDPFFTTKGEEGTGLGLPVSYQIVKRHGGEMRVDSQPGGGTTFTVTLPVGTVAGFSEPPETDPANDRKARILLVDNDPQVMTILGEMLRDAGHEVRSAGSGNDALQAFSPGAFDLVMTNIGMVGMNGWELAERLRKRDPRVPLVFITGWGMQEQDHARCRGLGLSAVLFKPVRPADLRKTIQQALAGTASLSGATAS